MRLRHLVVVVALAGCGEEAANELPGFTPEPGPGTGASGDPDGGLDYNPNLPPNPPPPAASGLPCDVAAIVEANCSLCHGAEVAGGAPNSLAKQSDFQALDPKTGKPYYELAKLRIHDMASPMPPVSQDRMSADEIATFSTWLEAGAPAASVGCGTPEFPVEGDGDGAAPVPTDITEIVYDDITDEDCDEIMEMRAFNPGNAKEGFPVGQGTDNTYECFIFDVPHDGKVQGLKIEPIIDDKRVLHHWLLYEQAGAGPGKNDYYNCAGQHPAAQLLAGWAPGRGATQMPRGVGLKLPEKGKGFYVLEMHYNNTGKHAGVRDRSGARICATKKVQANEAAVHWLGSELFTIPGNSRGNAVGTCTAPKRAVVLNSWPHMHSLGTNMKVELRRKGGTDTVVFDRPFSVADQRSYDTPMILEPGDRLRTTCTFENDRFLSVGFGTDSEAEMCYNFVLAYPAGALTSGFSLTITNGTCIDFLSL